MRRLTTITLAAGLLAAGMSPAKAYYHFVHYQNSAAPYAPIREKFDLRALPSKTVTFFVSDSGPTSYTPNDSFPSVLAVIRDATHVWNSIATSDLRVAFGGLQPPGTPEALPGAEVVFEELPPGLLAFAGPASKADITTGADGTAFVPILKSLIHLNIDLTQKPAPSYEESFFMTVVHEMGHAIGLQHTFTSATMSTAVTRATSRALPLDADDIAGISLLYPRGAYPSAFGSITGQVTTGGQGVHLASVVALLPNGSAVSALTNPDGTYEIDGVPPGSYWVYVHPLPPTADIWFPLDTNGNPVAPSAPFVSTFYPGTSDPTQFTSVTVAAGAAAGGINFAVAPRQAVEVYDISTYSFFGNTPVQPAYLNANANVTYQTIVANGTGITSGSSVASGLSVQVLGGPGPALYRPYGAPNTSVAIYLRYPAPPNSGPEHLLFTLSDDIYVLPAGIQMTQSQPPQVIGLAPNPDGSVTVTGTGMAAGSRVFFDSLPGQVTVPYAAASDQSGNGSVSVTPPPGAGGQTSTITVFNSDGQNSMFLQSQAPQLYTYPQAAAPAATLSISALPQGASSLVDIKGSNMQFVDGLTTAGFGSSDIAVQQVWVLSPTHAVANVTVSPWALQQFTAESVISGFQVYEQPAGFQVLPANPNLPIMGLPVVNGFAVLNSLFPGAIATIYGLKMVAPSATPVVTVANLPVQILYASATQINFLIPAGVPLGPQVLKLNSGATNAHPVLLQIDPPPPVITAVTSAAGVVLDQTQTAAPGDTITLTVTGLDPAAVSASNRVAVAEGVLTIPAFTIQPVTGQTGVLQIQFSLAGSVTGTQIPITVSQDGDLSFPVFVNIAVPPASGG